MTVLLKIQKPQPQPQGGFIGTSFALVSHGLNKGNLHTDLQLLFYPKPVQFTNTRTALCESVSADNRRDSHQNKISKPNQNTSADVPFTVYLSFSMRLTTENTDMKLQ